MTITLYLSQVTSDIAALNVPGITFIDYDGIVSSWKAKANVFYPNQEGFITDFKAEWQSFEKGAGAAVDILYTLHYRFLGVQIGDSSTVITAYPDMVNNMTEIIETLLETDRPYSGRVDMSVSEMTFGVRADPVGNMYYGADIALNVREMHEAT